MSQQYLLLMPAENMSMSEEGPQHGNADSETMDSGTWMLSQIQQTRLS